MELRHRALRPSAAVVGAVAAAILGGCHSGNQPAPVGPGGGFTISERAESAPIAAIAVKPPYLWVAGAAGLRRFDIAAGEWEQVGALNDPKTRAITAIAADDD